MVEFAASMPGMSFPKKPRSGQARVVEESKQRALLNVKLPTGYGKTLAACYVYSIKKWGGVVNRLLLIFPTDGQAEQFIKNGHKDLVDAGIDGPTKIVDVRHSGAQCLKHHRGNTSQVFVITIQSLIESRGFDNVSRLLETGQWMIVVDEYHHYGVGKSWGRTVLRLNRAFLLAMSATPSRPNDDSAFGTPHVDVSYRFAVEEGACKRLRAHAYNYRIEAIGEDGDIVFTTADLIKAAGGDTPEKIEKVRIERKMRWSPRYVSPLLHVPIDRMIGERIATRHPLQVLISAMCVSHAELICEQVRAMYPELQSDWVGTGQNGRSDEENDRILTRFCPPKDEHGERHPTLDILVHVGMAGEGLDTVHVSEVVLMCNASICNRILQIIGRGARQLSGVVCNVSFDSSSEFAAKGYVGEAIMDAMDLEPPKKDDNPPDEDDPEWPKELPENPEIHISNIELLNIDSGMDGVRHMAKVMEALSPKALDFDALRHDKDHSDWSKVIDTYRQMRKIEAEEHDERAIIEQWREKVKFAMIDLTTVALLTLKKQGVEVNSHNRMTLRGVIKKRINERKKQFLGEVSNDLELLKKHYGWCKSLDRDLRERQSVPSWLSL
jgi:superfamily II DNA or RNA helicase